MNYLTLENCLQYALGKIPPQEELRQIMQLKQSTLSNRARRNGKIKQNEIELLNKHYNFNLLEVEKTLVNLMKNEQEFVLPESIVCDYYYDVFGSCGNGTFVLSETTAPMTVSLESIANYSHHKKYSVINARGDSMQPYIIDGDKLVIEHYNGAQIVDNSIYVFRYEDNIFIKRLIHNIDQIIIKSDNKEYATRCIERNDLQNFQVIGQVVGLLRKC